jgi:multicomponent Na+:H+ antiporter subunit D
MLSGIYPAEIRAINLDTDWFYRKGAKAFLWIVNKPIASFEYKVVGEAYEFMVIKPMMKIAVMLRSFDAKAVDGSVNGIGKLTVAWSAVMRIIQNGKVHDYAFIMSAGICAVVALILLVRG